MTTTIKAAHTPGPWHYNSGMVWADSNEHVAIARADRAEPTTLPTERDANARLIAAAPEMLEALIQADLQIEYMQAKFKETGTGNSVRAQLQAAIRKARGGQ